MEWTSKHRPTSLDGVRGNKDAVRDLRKWADTWDDHGEAVILHGRPGIGKTTAAHALANDAGWDSIEMNASEQRTKDIVKKVAGSAAVNGTLHGGVDGLRLVVLDEADSLHGNVDRGGTGAMTELVKSASQPVVLIANEYYEMSRGLRNACQDIEFELVDNRAVKRFLQDIADDEGIEYTRDALQAIAQQADGDIRGAVNDLQAVATRVDDTLTVDDLPTGARDRTENIFSFMDVIFQEGTPQEAREAAHSTSDGSSHSVDETPDTLFNWIEDNIVKEYKGDELWKSYKFLARADEWLGRVQATQNYKYWKYVTDQMTTGVAASREGRHSGWTRWGPPSYWSKLGQTKGTRNTRNAIARQVAERSGVSLATARQEVLPFLSTITHHCKNREVTVAMAAVYDLNAKEVSFITGSGESTNKIASIIEDAQELQEEAAFESTTGGVGLGDATKLQDGVTDAANDSGSDNSGDSQQTLGSTTTDTDSETNSGSDDSASGESETDAEQTTLF